MDGRNIFCLRAAQVAFVVALIALVFLEATGPMATLQMLP